jgi:hypothetical protein
LGYFRTSDGEIGIDPDRQIQDAVKLVFETFEQLGSAMSWRALIGRVQA